MGLTGWVLLVAGLLAGLIALAFVAGSRLPRTHLVARTLQSVQPAEIIWEVITDFPGVITWYPQLTGVERLPDREGREVWRENHKGCPPLRLETLEAFRPRRLVRSIVDEKQGFSGRWEFDITPCAGGSQLTITEHGEIPHPFFRFLARVFMNPATYIERYLKALAQKLGEPAIIEDPATPSGRSLPP